MRDANTRATFILVFILVATGCWFRSRVEISVGTKAIAKISEARNKTRSQNPTHSLSKSDTTTQAVGSILQANRPQTQSNQNEGILNDQAYCKVVRANTGIELSGKLKVFTLPYERDEDGRPGFTFLVQSSECPPGLFSKARIDELGRVKEALDCRTVTKEQILSQSGVQGSIEDQTPSAERMDLAISGEGYFVTACPGGMFLQRSGDFQRKGNEIWYGTCRVLNRDGEPLELPALDGQELDEYGCTPNRSCIAIVGIDPTTVTFIDRTSFRASDDPILHLIRNPRLFSNALEVFGDSNSGPTGPYWENLPEFIRPLNCPDQYQ